MTELTDADKLNRRLLGRAAAILEYIVAYQLEDPRGEDTFDGLPMSVHRDIFLLAADGKHTPEAVNMLTAPYWDPNKLSETEAAMRERAQPFYVDLD